ncbi:MAG: tyrosine-type recombinase/integrase [Planctomycetaceae bacterium]
MEEEPSNCLVRQTAELPQTFLAAIPTIVEQAGGAARFAWEEFVYARIRNEATRRAYLFAVRQFLRWCSERRVPLKRIAPAHVGRYLDEVEYAPATKKLHLSAIRHFFDELALRHVVILNPALSVRGERLRVVEGKTPEISIKTARRLLTSIECSHVIGLRDRAVIGIMIYTAARVGAIARLRRGDYYANDEQYCLRMIEKGTQFREIPVRHNLRGFVLDYITAACLEYSEKHTPLFRTTIRKTKTLTQNGMTTRDMARMLKRRLADAGLPSIYSPHSFRVYVATGVMWCWVRCPVRLTVTR